MTSEAQTIGIDRLNERVAVPRVADEIGHLAVTLNAMLDRLEHGVAREAPARRPTRRTSCARRWR